MGAVTITGKSLQEFRAAARDRAGDIPDGTPVEITVRFVGPVGLLGDAAGSEWWAQRLIGPEGGVEVTDVHATGGVTRSRVTVKGLARGVPVLVIVGLAVAALGALALAIREIRMLFSVPLPGGGQLNLLPLVALGGAVLVFVGARRRR